MNRLISCGLGAAAVSLLLSMNAAAATLAQQCGAFGIVTYDPEPKTGFEAWAENNGITGMWNEKSSGIYNVFRYVFGQTTGDFAVITGIDVGESKVVITTPTISSLVGVTVTVVESSDVAGETITDTKELTEEGSAEFDKSAATPRFYRLSAEVTE